MPRNVNNDVAGTWWRAISRPTRVGIGALKDGMIDDYEVFDVTLDPGICHMMPSACIGIYESVTLAEEMGKDTGRYPIQSRRTRD